MRHFSPEGNVVELPTEADPVKVAPTGGLILDPFAGSGTTGIAAALEGRRCLLIEKEPAYAAICRQRVAKVMDAGLFAEAST